MTTFKHLNAGVVFDRLAKSDWWEVQLDGMPAPALVRLGRAADGRLVCTGVVLGAGAPEQEVPARSLRQVQLGAIVSRFHDMTRRTGPVSVSPAVAKLIADSASIPVAVPKLRPGPKGHPRAHFENMAERYRSALVTNPRSPVKSVVAETGYPEATVRRHLRRARDLGLLEPAPPGKAGEARVPRGPRQGGRAPTPSR